MEYVLFVNKQGKLPKQAISDMQKEFISFAGKKIRVKIEKYSKKRSNSQNAYYWSCCIPPIVEKTGFTSDEIHEYLISKFIDNKKDIVVGGESEKVNKRTHDLTTTEFMGYIADIQRFAAEKLDLVIPDPDPLYNDSTEYLDEQP